MLQSGVIKITFNMSIFLKSIKPSTPIVKDPKNPYEILTECLFGEKIQIFNNQNNGYSYGKLITDGYYGWIKSEDLDDYSLSTHRVLALRTFVYQHPDIKSELIHYLPIGSLIKVTQIFKDWAEISLSDKNLYNKGYLSIKHIVDQNHKVVDWVSVAEKFLGTPYRWGGRDSLGVDCSALVQLSMQSQGFLVPRDTSMQINCHIFAETDFQNANRGCLIFWGGHVAIFIDKTNIIHSNAYSMSVIREPLNSAIERIKKKYGDVVKILRIKT